MTYNYVKRDGCVLRSQSDRPPLAIELYTPNGWEAYPEPASGDVRASSTAAWFEGTPLSEAEAEALTGTEAVTET